MMSREEFKTKALQILMGARFGPLPLFESEDLDEYVVADEQGTLPLEIFLDDLYEVLENE